MNTNYANNSIKNRGKVDEPKKEINKVVYELLSDEDIEEYFLMEEKENEENFNKGQNKNE